MRELSEKGQLLPDDLILEILDKRLSQDDARGHFILDGFPRKVSQAVRFRAEIVGLELYDIYVCVDVDG